MDFSNYVIVNVVIQYEKVKMHQECFAPWNQIKSNSGRPIWFTVSPAPIQDILYCSATAIAFLLYHWNRFPVRVGSREGRGGAGFLGLWGTVKTHFGICCRIRWSDIFSKIDFLFQSHSENLNMPHKEKQSLHTQDQEELSTVEEEIKESKSYFIYSFSFFRPKQLKSFQAPFHAAETVWPYLIIIIENCALVY